MQADPAPQNLITVPVAARERNLGERQLRRAIEANELPAYQIGGWTRVRLGDVDEWIQSRRKR